MQIQGRQGFVQFKFTGGGEVKTNKKERGVCFPGNPTKSCCLALEVQTHLVIICAFDKQQMPAQG